MFVSRKMELTDSARIVLIIIVCSAVLCLSDELYRCPSHLPRTSYLKRYRNFCFEFNSSKPTVDWVEARQMCLGRGGYLAEPRDNGLQIFLRNTAKALGFNAVGFWIGLTDRTIEGKFVWEHSKAVTSWSNWGKGEPDSWCITCVNDCVVMKEHHGYKWYDKKCSGALSPDHHYICQYNMGPDTTTTKTTAIPTTTAKSIRTSTQPSSQTTTYNSTSAAHTNKTSSTSQTNTTVLPGVVGQQVDDEQSLEHLIPVLIALGVVASLVIIVILILVLSKTYRWVSRQKLLRGQLASFDNVAYGVSSERVGTPPTVNDLQNNLNQMHAQQNVYNTPYLHAISETDTVRSRETRYDNIEAEKNCSTFSDVTMDKLFVNLDQGDGKTTDGACGGYDTLKSSLKDVVSDIDTLQYNVNNYAEIQDDVVIRSSSLDSRHYDEISIPNEATYSNINTFLKDIDEDEISKPSVNLAFENNLYKDES